MRSAAAMTNLRKILTTTALSGVLVFGTAGAAAAHIAGPCEDADGDGMPSGREYAAHHISAMAKEQMIGGDGHKPGTHQGFSACDPSGR
jgi:hypothetical protein